MRLEVDRELAKILDEIKKREPSVYGRGHVETVRFLANYYEQHKPLQQLYDDLRQNLTHFLENLEGSVSRALQQVFPETTAQFISNLLTTRRGPDANLPPRGQDPGARSSAKRRRGDEREPAADLLQEPEETLK